MIGRRVATVVDLELPGDYAGPIRGYTDGSEACFFLLPIANDPDAPPSANGVHHVTFPPHTYRECADGSLEIRNSIGAQRWATDPGAFDGYVWHGYLDEGHVWRTA